MPALTVSAWVLSRAPNNFPLILKAGNDSTGWILDNNQGKIQLVVNYTGDDLACLGALYSIPEDQWTYVTATWDGTGSCSGVKLYSNGVITSGSTQNPTLSREDDSGNNVLIGSDTYTFMNGIVDDVKIYNYARTQGQIIEDMNAGHPAPGSPVGSPVGYWKFVEGYGDTANDSGSGGSTYNASLAG